MAFDESLGELEAKVDRKLIGGHLLPNRRIVAKTTTFCNGQRLGDPNYCVTSLSVEISSSPLFLVSLPRSFDNVFARGFASGIEIIVDSCHKARTEQRSSEQPLRSAIKFIARTAQQCCCASCGIPIKLRLQPQNRYQ